MVYENELWHSFLLRSQIMYNLSNCRNIISKHGALRYDAFPRFELIDMYGFAPIFPDICYHLTHYKPAAADIPVASDNPAH
ncbi:hypothetical protein, partial [Escherichia coli]|uniref:hypothetical protein n=1 Tax=Escherichia coli TaxID=562 RepID=UPI00280B0930